jgi:glycosyltransferase involved in cell wall biosynthesis
LRNRAGARPIVIAVLGHQRVAKGYDRLPEIAAELLRRRPDIRLLVQNVLTGPPTEIGKALHEIAARDDRLILDETPAGAERWAQLLERSDLVLCPHRPEHYVAGVSTVVAEALANGIPLVVPAGTTLADIVAKSGGGGTTFDRFELESIAAATDEALDGFNHFATLAHEAALRWPETHGSARMVDALMSLVAAS